MSFPQFVWLPLIPVDRQVSRQDPTAIVLPSPEIADDWPNSNHERVFEALRYACWLQVVPERVNTYAAPAEVIVLSDWLPLTPVALLDSSTALTTSVLPSSETPRVQPKKSFESVFDALRYAC